MLSSSKLLILKFRCQYRSYLNHHHHYHHYYNYNKCYNRAFSQSIIIPTAAVFHKVAFIGVGKMAQAMIQPLIQTGLQPASQIHVYDVSSTSLKAVVAQFPGIQTSLSLSNVVADADLVVCAVKPQNVTPDFFKAMGTPSPHTTLLSVIAGKPMETFTTGGFTKVARSMPNTPAQIGQGMTVWCCTDNIDLDERDKIKQILSSFGKSVHVDDEDFIDMSTAISGSGPAYIFMLMEAMIDAGVHMGFSRDTATTLVHHTLLGSTLYAMETGDHPVILRNRVTSPAGTTASAIYELENGKFRTVIKDAIWACYRRSLEMGNKSSNVGPGRSGVVPTPIVHITMPPQGEMEVKKEEEEAEGSEVVDRYDIPRR